MFGWLTNSIEMVEYDVRVLQKAVGSALPIPFKLVIICLENIKYTIRIVDGVFEMIPFLGGS